MLGVAASTREVGDARPFDMVLVDAAGLPVFGFNPSKPSAAVITSVPSSVTSVELLAANPARKKFVIVNDGTKTLRIAFAATASATAFTHLLAAGASYESELNDYTGVISGIWQAVNGSARVTEMA